MRRTSKTPQSQTNILAGLERRSRLITFVLVAVATARIAATYTVYNHTSDEPAHVACGMEWLDKGIYQWEPQHPPLARIAAALGPYLSGIRSQNTPRDIPFAMDREGVNVLYSGHHYDRTLVLSRLGNLPFFWLGCFALYWWAAQLYGRAVAAIAVFLFSFSPIILGHAGLATTDMAVTAGMGAAFAAGYYWLLHPSWRSGVLFGAATAMMVGSKFSSLLFFPAAVAASLACYLWLEWPGWPALKSAVIRLAPGFAVAVATAMLLIWAFYRFSFGDSGLEHLRLPAPELFAGIRQVKEHNSAGHESYLLGVRGHTGFFWYFPVGLAVKTPLAFLFLLGIGIVVALRRHPAFPRLWMPLAFAAGILVPSLFSSITIGVRHVLPIYLGLSLLAAAGVAQMLEWSAARRWVLPVLGLLLVWFAGSSLLAHPDYLPYFNEIAGSQPEKILADSDLDWGQDLKRLSARLRELGANEVSFDVYIYGDWEKEHGFPKIYKLNRDRPSVGWNAVSVGVWKETDLLRWPDVVKPQERVGKSILLYYFPPQR